MALATVKTWVKGQPTLEPLVPWLRGLAHGYRCYVKPVLRLFWVVPRDLVYLVFLPYRLHFFLNTVRWLEKEGKKRIRVPSPWPGPRHIVMLVNSDLRSDPRVEREARALAAQEFHVTVISPAWSPNPADCRIHWGPNIDFRVLSHKAARFNMYYPYLFGQEMFDAALAENAWAYHAHDLDMSLIGLLAAAKNEAACVCDFHEWYSENVSYSSLTRRYKPHAFYKRWAYQKMERLVMHAATEVITVCDSIGASLSNVYGAPKPVRIIRNIPQIKTTDRPSTFDLRKELGIPTDKKIVLYQGGLGPSRNLEPVIAAMAQVPHAVFVIRGPGYEHWAKSYYRLASRLEVRDKVFCLPPVPSARVVAEARGADVGLWTLLANVGLNFKYSLPNKVFEYMAAGVPLAVADLPEVRKIVAGYKIGVCFDPVSPASIARAITQLTDDAVLRDQCRRNIATAVRELGADQEWNKLVELYRHLGQRN